MLVEQPGQSVALATLDRAIGEHERRRRLLPARERSDVPRQPGPARVPVSLREIPARRRERDAVDGGDAFCATLVVLEVGAERLLGELVDERRPAGEALLAREHGLGARELHRQVADPRERLRIACPRCSGELLRLLAKLFQVHVDLLPLRPVSAAGGERDRFVAAVLPGGGLSPSRGPVAPSRAGPILAQTVSAGFGPRGQSSSPTKTRKRPRQRKATGPAHDAGPLGGSSPKTALPALRPRSPPIE